MSHSKYVVPQASEPKAGKKEWTALAVLILPLLLVSMDVSVLYFAVPFISEDLGPTATQQLWIFDIYGFVLAGLLITMGSLGDRIGRRRLLLIGAVGFGLASVGAAYAGSAEMLIAARALQGIGGATLMPSTLALIRNMFHDASQRSKAIAIWTATMTGGVALGPVLSGVLLEHFWWGSVFLINTPFMVLLLVLVPILVPEFKNLGGTFDLISSALSLAAVLPLIYGIKKWAADGVSLTYLACIAFGLAVGYVFVRRQRVRRDPMIDLSLISNRAFSGSLIANTIGMFALVGSAIFTTQYLQSVLGFSPLAAALWSLLPSVVVGAAAPTAAVLAQRINRANIIAAGFAIGAVGLLTMSFVQPRSPILLVLVGAGLLAAGVVAVLTLVTELMMGAVSPERAGSASAVLETGAEFGGALGIAVLGSVGAAVYSSSVAQLAPAELSASSLHAVQETLGGALAVSAGLPGGGGAVLEAARTAFTNGMGVASIVGAVVLLGAAIGSLLILRPVGVPAAPVVSPE